MPVFSATAIQISGVSTPTISSVTIDCFTGASVAEDGEPVERGKHGVGPGNVAEVGILVVLVPDTLTTDVGYDDNWAARCSWSNRRNSPSALRRFSTGVSLTTLPSRMTTVRLVYWAMSSSWVTMIRGMPWSLSFWNTPKISML